MGSAYRSRMINLSKHDLQKMHNNAKEQILVYIHYEDEDQKNRCPKISQEPSEID